MGEERNVGFATYEIGIRDKANLNCVSKKMVLHKSFDLLKAKPTPSFKQLKPIPQEIKELRADWSEKMKTLQAKGYAEKEMLNLKNENDKLKDLDFLKRQDIPGHSHLQKKSKATKPSQQTMMKRRINDCMLRLDIHERPLLP